jgi:hypothetical protein
MRQQLWQQLLHMLLLVLRPSLQQDKEAIRHHDVHAATFGSSSNCSYVCGRSASRDVRELLLQHVQLQSAVEKSALMRSSVWQCRCTQTNWPAVLQLLLFNSHLQQLCRQSNEPRHVVVS